MRCSGRPSRSEGTNPASSLLSRNRDVSRFSPAPARPPTNVSHMPGSVDLLAARRAIQSRPSGDQAFKCKIGRAHGSTTVTYAHLACRLLLDNKNRRYPTYTVSGQTNPDLHLTSLKYLESCSLLSTHNE